VTRVEINLTRRSSISYSMGVTRKRRRARSREFSMRSRISLGHPSKAASEEELQIVKKVVEIIRARELRRLVRDLVR
jgi:hypothetical protein